MEYILTTNNLTKHYSHSPNPQAVAAGYQDVLYSYPLYSLSLIIILSGIGLVVFRKRDFK